MLQAVPNGAATIAPPPMRALDGGERSFGVRLSSIASRELALFDDRRRHLLAVSTNVGTAELEMPLRLATPSAGSRWRVRGTAYLLTLDLELGEDGGGRYQWTLEPGGRDAAGRARVLDLLIALGGQGVLTITDPELGEVALAQLHGRGPADELVAQRAFLSEILVVEAWAQTRLPLPEQLGDTDRLMLAQVVEWLRTRRAQLRITSEIIARVSQPLPDEPTLTIPLKEPASANLLGLQLHLGTWHFRVPVQLVDPAVPDGDTWVVRLQAPERSVTASLRPRRRSIPALARRIRDGYVPPAEAPPPTRRRERALREAEKLVASWELAGPEVEGARDELRRRWPT